MTADDIEQPARDMDSEIGVNTDQRRVSVPGLRERNGTLLK